MSHTPVRTCCSCHKQLPQAELVRIVRTKNNNVVINKKSLGLIPGRGVYLCKNYTCVAKAFTKKRKAIDRALKVATDEKLQKEITDYIDEE